MPLFEQEFLKPGKYKIGDSLREFTRDDLKAYKDGTAAALKAGVPIPLFDQHSPPGVETGYPLSETDTTSALKGRGWLRDVKQRENGSLVSVLEVNDPEAVKGIENGSIRFTSPEFREKYTDGKGRSFGRIMRHFALTGKPRNPDQGPFLPVANATPFGECLQFSLDDMETTEGAAPEHSDEPTTKDEPNPDMPKKSGQDKQMEAVHACLEELGVVLADDVDIMTPEGLLAMLSALKTAAASKQKAEADKEAEEDKPGGNIVQDSNMGTQFSERERGLIAERDAARAKLSAVNRTAQEAKITAAIASLPPALKAKLTERLAAVQFSDDGAEQPGLTVLEVASLVKECLPASLQFDETTAEEAKHEEAKFFNADTSGDVAIATPEIKALNDQYYRDLGYATPPQRSERGRPILLDNVVPAPAGHHQQPKTSQRQTAGAK